MYCSAHGLGTTALSAKESEAVPFCAISYALIGIFGLLLFIVIYGIQKDIIVCY